MLACLLYILCIHSQTEHREKQRKSKQQERKKKRPWKKEEELCREEAVHIAMAMIRTTAFSMNPCVLLPMMMMIMVSYQWGGQIGMVSAADHNVGGSSDWALGVDYSDWASTQTFSVGDNLGKISSPVVFCPLDLSMDG